MAHSISPYERTSNKLSHLDYPDTSLIESPVSSWFTGLKGLNCCLLIFNLNKWYLLYKHLPMFPSLLLQADPLVMWQSQQLLDLNSCLSYYSNRTSIINYKAEKSRRVLQITEQSSNIVLIYRKKSVNGSIIVLEHKFSLSPSYWPQDHWEECDL